MLMWSNALLAALNLMFGAVAGNPFNLAVGFINAVVAVLLARQ